jgi:outer membrane receptor protein involved in Fe transport
MFLTTVSRIALCLSAASGVVAFPALAQSNAPSPASPVDGGEIIVTGRAGNSEQKKVEASYAISTISEEDLQMRAPVGIGEALKNVPGFWIENSSGEASGNIRVRGIPTDGYASVGLLEDGIATQADAGLGWLNADQSVRMDQGVQRIEVVRGGPSSIFYSNAPGAVINMITRRGGDQLEGLIRYEYADYGSHRVDGWISGPIGNSDWRFFAGGYYRLSDGQRHSGYRQDEGGQIRANISREFDKGSIMLGVKRIDERIGNAQGGIFMTGTDGQPTGVPSFNVKRDTIAGPETRTFDFLTPDGIYKFDNAQGTDVELTQLTFDGEYKFSDAVSIQHKMRYRDSYTRRNSITPYSVARASDLIKATYGKAVGAGQSLGLFYTNDGAAFDLADQNGNALALVNLARSYTVPLEEFISDTRVLASFEALGHHDVALGGYFAHVNEQYSTNSASVLTDVKDNASVLDVYLTNTSGQKLYQFTNGGIMAYGSEFNHASGTSETIAAYASDEWQVTDKLRIDGGIRLERIHMTGEVEGRKKVNLGISPTAADDSVTTGSGVYTPFDRQFDSTAWTLGGNYQFRPEAGLFLRYTNAFRLPGVSSFLGNANAKPVTQKMNFLEGGLKYSRGPVDLYVTGFRSIYKSYEISDYRTATDGTLVLNTVYGDTKTWGAEVEANWHPTDWFDVRATWTYQNARFTDFKYTNSAGQQIDYSKNRLIRVPENSFRISPGVNLLDHRLRVQSDIGYYGQRYAEVANQISLPSYWQVDMSARFDVTDKLQLSLIVNNITNEIGLSNGNPRAGAIENGEAGDSVYIGSSIYGRNARAAVTFRF